MKRELRSRSIEKQGARQGVVAQGAALLALASSFSGISFGRESNVAGPAQTPAEAASIMTIDIHHHLPILFDPDKELIWSPVGSKRPRKEVTSVEISEKINGKNAYFQIDQTGNSIGSMVVRVIRASKELSVDSAFDAAGTPPGDRIRTDVGVIENRGSKNTPSAEVEYANGSVDYIPVGVTHELTGCS